MQASLHVHAFNYTVVSTNLPGQPMPLKMLNIIT